ncbi:MAG: site-specific DNA-methyltransferase, partial [Acidobacteria bacterium]|nr:site-specific DNA-methyltransferase [Acidobacteriota bacterium]
MAKLKGKNKGDKVAERYTHYETTPMRPDVGTQPQFRKKKPPQTYRYDSSLAPALDWDGQNGARELGEWLLGLAGEAAALAPSHEFAAPKEFRAPDGRVLASVRSLQDALGHLKRLSRPFLNWTGKSERLSFDVPTLPLFVHERLSTKAIVDTLVGHRKTSPQTDMWELFGDPQRSIVDQTLRAYEYQDRWVNRLILGDSLVVMNSLLQYEGLGGQVQMIYIDPPYGVKFGSNFQPFVRRRDVTHGDDQDFTREPEMVKAYRDTWELGLHSYLTYMRDRLTLARELLSTSGSVFVQISKENLHHVREVLEEIFGAENFCGQIDFATTTSQTSQLLAATVDHLLWFAKSREAVKFRQLFLDKDFVEIVRTTYNKIELPDGTIRAMTVCELSDTKLVPEGSKILSLDNTTSRSGSESTTQPFQLNGQVFKPKSGGWKTNVAGLESLAKAGRLHIKGMSLLYKRYYNDFPFTPLTQLWTDTQLGGFLRQEEKLYAVQTPLKVISRCLLMTTDPGDLVLDPT